jgi:hypothetical protein
MKNEFTVSTCKELFRHELNTLTKFQRFICWLFKIKVPCGFVMQFRIAVEPTMRLGLNDCVMDSYGRKFIIISVRQEPTYTLFHIYQLLPSFITNGLENQKIFFLGSSYRESSLK